MRGDPAREDPEISGGIAPKNNTDTVQFTLPLADICGIDKRLTTHVARHTFATLTLANKVTMDNVARMMGHANTQITRHYARILDSSILRDMQVVAENM